MNWLILNSISRSVAILILCTFLVIGLFGLFSGMEMDRDGKMGNCPFTVSLSVCNMSALEHLRAWQSILSSVPKLFGALTLLTSLFILFFIILYSILKNIWSDASLFRKHFHSRFYTSFSHNLLQEAFSRGILNSKAY